MMKILGYPSNPGYGMFEDTGSSSIGYTSYPRQLKSNGLKSLHIGIRIYIDSKALWKKSRTRMTHGHMMAHPEPGHQTTVLCICPRANFQEQPSTVAEGTADMSSIAALELLVLEEFSRLSDSDTQDELITVRFYISANEIRNVGCTNPPGGFDPNTMDFAPTPPHAGTITHVICKPGFTPKASSQPSVIGPNVDPGLSPGLYKCEGKRNSTKNEDPSLYSFYGSIKEKVLVSEYNLFEEVKHTIRCDEAELFNMLPAYASLAAARSKLTEEEFGSNQVSEFSRYGNIVTYRCIESYFFADLSFEKYVECALKDGDDNVGEWKGYTGTILPLPQTCLPVTCQYEHVLLKESYNIEPNFTIEYPDGTISTVDKLEPIPYPYQTRIYYACKKGYETVIKKFGQNITCGPIGRWLPQLAGCTKTEDCMITSSSGRYVPPLVEAPFAKELGFIIIAFIVAFFICPLLLDLATVKRDFACFFKNIRLQKRLWQATRRLRKAKQAAREEKED
ncbi:hypothetical protein ACTXT7_002641 [Hymenolepis weldensis]